MEYKRFIKKPSVEMYPGIRVTKDTELTYQNENVEQTVKDLVFHSVTKKKGDNWESTWDTVIQLAEGDILIFEDEGRGYIKPAEELMTAAEAVEELRNIIDLE